MLTSMALATLSDTVPFTPGAGTGSPFTPQAEPGLSARMASLRTGLSSLLADLDPGLLTGRDSAALYNDFCHLERLVTAGKTLLAPRIAESGHWEAEGHRSPAGLLANLEGGSAGQAKRTLEAGQRLVDLPATEEALRKGTLSGPKLSEITQAASLDPGSEGQLLAGSETEPLHALKARCRQVRTTAAGNDPRATLARIHANRSFKSWTDDDGSFCFEGRDSADRGAKFLARLLPVVNRLRIDRRAAAAAEAKDRAKGTPPPVPEREAALRADAFFLLLTGVRSSSSSFPASPSDSSARSAPSAASPPWARPPAAPSSPSVSSAPPASSGSPDSSSSSTAPSPASADRRHDGHRSGAGVRPSTTDGTESTEHISPVGHDATCNDSRQRATTQVADPADLGRVTDLIGAVPPATVIVRVDLAALRRGRALPGELSEIEGHGPVPVQVVQSLIDDAFLACVFTEAGDIKAVAHLGRTINQHLRTALALRDKHCVVPGCGVGYSLEIDHVLPLESGGDTRLDNLALLCSHHHRKKTYEGWTLERRGPTDEDPSWAFTPEPPFGQEPDLGLDRLDAPPWPPEPVARK